MLCLWYSLQIPIEGAYLYDNVYNVYAPALNETLADGYDIRNGTEILHRILCKKHASKNRAFQVSSQQEQANR